MSQILVTEQGTTEKWTVPCDIPELGIGRGTNNAITLHSKGVSRHHAIFFSSGHEYFIEDQGSGNGTSLNGSAIKPHQRYLVRPGDVITIDHFHLHFSLGDKLEQSFNEVTDSDMMEVKLLKKVMRALDKDTLPSLEVMNGVAAGKKIFVRDTDTELVVGRDPNTDFMIEEYAVSRQHARLRRDENEIRVEDLKSKNGTYLNQKKVTSEILRDGDRVAFGTIVCIFRNPREVNLEAVNVQAKAHRDATRQAIAEKQAEHVDVEREDDESSEDATAIADEAPPDIEGLPGHHANIYPTPQPKRSLWDRLSLAEMGLLWAGILVFLVTSILLVQLWSE
jgi:pSer/pThr/pTyr-binding forkhead associated (FHA) protein